MLSPKEFRNLMAENGQEFTVDQASKILKSLRILKKKLDKSSDLNLMSSQEKQRLRMDAAENGIEIAPDEFHQIHNLMAQVQQLNID